MAGVPPDREAALLALVAQIDRSSAVSSVAGPCPGAATALWLCLRAAGGGTAAGKPRQWASGFLAECRALDEARLVLRCSEAGELHLAAGAAGTFEARFDGERAPSLWLERRDMAEWAGFLARDMHADRERVPGTRNLVANLALQLPYPTNATIADVPVSACCEVLAALHDHLAVPGRADGGTVLLGERELIQAIAELTGIAVEVVGPILSVLTMDGDNAEWHAALPGAPIAPLVRVAGDTLAPCGRGLRTEPGLFLTRELRRRDPERYHNDAHQREIAFRTDLYTLFANLRYVVSVDRIVLRRDDRRNRTDIDAAIFDRKTGTLAVFELKSQDPLARTVGELERQRENLTRAGRQVSAILDWINRNGGDEVLNRMDRGTAKRFRVQRVLPFVLGRYLADCGGSRNARIAWGSWGQVLRELVSIESGNPLLSLHDRLVSANRVDEFRGSLAAPKEVRLGQSRILVRDGWPE